MDSVQRLEFDTLPSLGSAYRKVPFQRKPGIREGQTIPRIEAIVKGVKPEAQSIFEYAKICRFTSDEKHIPSIYPHILASPLHMMLVTHKAFPLKGMGLIHVRNVITEHRPIDYQETLDLLCFVEGHREAPKGVEFDLHTQVSSNGEVVWEGITTVLSRQKGKGQGNKKKEKKTPLPGGDPDCQRSALWKVPADMGRIYASVSGDYNPIHLYKWTAKLLGFPRAIIHGMWSFARCVAEVTGDLPERPLTYEVEFKLPILLPSTVLFSSQDEEDKLSFAIHSKDGSKPHLKGRIYSSPKA